MKIDATKASELIKMLQKEIKEHGDLTVGIPHFFPTKLKVTTKKGDDVINGGLFRIVPEDDS